MKTYVGPTEAELVIQNRYDAWRSRATCENIEGRRLVPPTVFKVIQALASMAEGKAVAYGTPPIEYYKFLLYVNKVIIAEWVISYYMDLAADKPTGWDKAQLVGIQGSKQIGGFDKLRWVGKTAAAQKWYVNTIVV